jgi:hypothetical protein
MPQALRQMANRGIAYPDGMKDRSEWIKELHTMADGFEAARRVHQMEFENDEEYQLLMARTDQALELFKKHFFSLWD